MRVLHAVTAVAVLTMVASMPDARAVEGFTSYGPKEAERRYESAVKQARQNYLAELRRALASMPTSQIDEANRVNAVIKRIEAEITRPPAEPSTESQSTNDTIKILVGRWSIQGDEKSGWYKKACTFKEDGRTTSGGPVDGKWELKEDRVLITWDDGKWDALVLPLNRKSTAVDCSTLGGGKATATKLK